ncbi:MAG: hypothetical protein FWE42_09440 [Defluviitaleaceae bacterium]|nr:hypothetical protein [Defluviitaleaceae bacterium]
MAYKLRFVQKIDQAKKNEFLAIEKEFIKFEKANPHMPQGTRYLPVSGKEPTNTLVWECEFETLEKLTAQLQAIYNDLKHEELLQQQIPYMQDSYTEIYEVLS